MPDIVGRLRSPRLTPAPGSPAPGEMYYDTGSNTLLWWSGTAWVPTGKGGVAGSSWVSALSAAPVLDVGMTGQVRAGRQITLADFTALGLGAPVALWSLGLSDGGGNDSSGNGRNLTNKGSVNLGTPGINNLPSTCAQFVGTLTEALFRSDIGSYLDPFRLATGSWGCWSQTSQLATLQPCVGKWGGAAQTRAYTLLVDSTNVATTSVFIDGTNAVGSTYGTTNVADGRWHFLVGTYDGSTVRLYVDGVLEGATATPGWPIYITATGPVNVGSLGADASTNASYAHYGSLDEAFITADVLTPDQIRYLYCAKIPHALGKVPTAVSLNVRRQRKGGPLAVSDFPGAPLRLYNFTGGSGADLGSNATPINPPARVGKLTAGGYSTSPRVSSAGGGSVTIPAAGVPAGSTIILVGYQLTACALTVSDTKGNSWRQRAGGSPGIFVFDCQVTTALVSGNTITVTEGTGGTAFAFTVSWYGQCYFDTMAQGTFSGTAAAGPTITTKAGGGPVLGVFGIYNGANGSPTPSLGSSGQGPGYSVETTTFQSDFSTTPYEVHALCWEAKIGAGGVAEAATGTLNDGGTQRFGATIAYTALPSSAPGADGAQNGGVAFNGSLSLSTTDTGLPVTSSGSMTYGCWLKTSTRAVMGVMGWAGASGNGERIITLSDGTLRFDEGSLTTQGPFIADGQWHFVVVVLNSSATYDGRRKFYVDGRLVGSTTNYGSTTLGGSFRIGAVQDGTSPFTGAIDSVFVYPYPVSSASIAQLYAKGSLPLPPSPKDPGVHVDAVDATNIYATFDSFDSQHQIDLAVGA